MKKIFILLTFLCSSAIAANTDEYTVFMESLKLSENQSQKIENIEKKYNARLAKLNADAILRKMEKAQLKVQKDSYLRISYIDNELEAMKDEYMELRQDKQEEIASVLGFVQRYKYKKFCKTNAKNEFNQI